MAAHAEFLRLPASRLIGKAVARRGVTLTELKPKKNLFVQKKIFAVILPVLS